MTNFIFTLHSSRLHSPVPLKNGAECILREFSVRTWLFVKRTLHQRLLFLTPRLNIVVQAPPNKRPPLGNSLISMSSQSFLVSLNFFISPLMSTRRKRSSKSMSLRALSYHSRKKETWSNMRSHKNGRDPANDIRRLVMQSHALTIPHGFIGLWPERNYQIVIIPSNK